VHTQDLTSSYAVTLGRWIDNVRKNRDAIEAKAPGFARILQAYMTVARLQAKTGLTHQATRNVIKDAVSRGWLEEVGRRDRGGPARMAGTRARRIRAVHRGRIPSR
jgi:Fic family protein